MPALQPPRDTMCTGLDLLCPATPRARVLAARCFHLPHAAAARASPTSSEWELCSAPSPSRLPLLAFRRCPPGAAGLSACSENRFHLKPVFILPFSSSHLGQNLTAVFQSCFAPSGDLFRPATSQRSHRQGFTAAARGEIEGERGTLAALGEFLQTDAGRSVCGSRLGIWPWFQAEATSSCPGSRAGRRSRAAGAGLALPKGCAAWLSLPHGGVW